MPVDPMAQDHGDGSSRAAFQTPPKGEVPLAKANALLAARFGTTVRSAPEISERLAASIYLPSFAPRLKRKEVAGESRDSPPVWEVARYGPVGRSGGGPNT